MGDPTTYVEERYEFDAPRFYDFVEGTPEGSSDNAGDRWFETSATKGGQQPPLARAPAGRGRVWNAEASWLVCCRPGDAPGAQASGQAPAASRCALCPGHPLFLFAAQRKGETSKEGNACLHPSPAPQIT